MTASQDLELLVARIQQQLAPHATVTHNARLKGRLSGRDRQIDVLVSERVGQYEINIVIECKDYARPVDVKGVEEFIGLFTDVGAQKGVLVCPAGFTAAAKTRADQAQIDLYSPVDTDAHKWQARVTIPAVCDFRSAAISFGISSSTVFPFVIPYHFFEELAGYDPLGTELGNIKEAALRKWNEGRFPTEPGRYKKLPVFDSIEVLVESGYGRKIEAEIYVGLAVEQELFFGQLPLTRFSGFSDEIRGGLIANAFETGLASPDEIMSSWTRIDRIEDAPVRPVLTIDALLGWAQE